MDFTLSEKDVEHLRAIKRQNSFIRFKALEPEACWEEYLFYIYRMH
jgi:hypothetical protein